MAKTSAIIVIKNFSAVDVQLLVKFFFTDTLNRHAPIQHKRTRRNSFPWITPRIKALMRNRDYHKKRAIKYASQTHWESFKKLRNEVNIQMRNAKSIFFP